MTDFARTLGERIKQVRGPMSQAGFGMRLGVTKNTIGNYERGDRQPDAEFLARIRDEFRVSVDWLLTGWTPPPNWDDDKKYLEGIEAGRAAAEPAPAQPAEAVPAGRIDLDEDLHGRVLEGVSAVYTEMGARIALRDLGRLAARIHTDLIAAYDDPTERPSGLKMALQQLRRDLAAPPSAQTQTKYSA